MVEIVGVFCWTTVNGVSVVLVPPSVVVTLTNHFPKAASAGIVKLPGDRSGRHRRQSGGDGVPYVELKSVTVVLPGPGWKFEPAERELDEIRPHTG